MTVVFPESPQTLPGMEAKINYSNSEALLFVRLRACSHKPRTVNYPGAIIVTSRSHDDLLSRGNNFIAPGQAHRHLNSFSLNTNC